MTVIRTTCPYCGVGCGVAVRPPAQGEGVEPVRGLTDHPANLGRLCVKGSALADTLEPANRLLRPRLHGQDVSWDTALDTVAAGLARTRQQYGAGAIAFYLSGQLLTEDYYVANKLAKGYIGTPHVDTNSRLCMASATVAHQRAFGEDLVPGCYEDLDHCELALLIGSNAAWTHPVLLQRLLAARERYPERRIVVVDPRRTATAEIADLHLPLAPDSDIQFLAGLLVYLDDQAAIDRRYIADHTEGYSEALNAARAIAPDLAATARYCGVPASDLALAYQWFAGTERAVTLFSQGVNQSRRGSDTGSAIINLHLATGRIGRPGSGPFSLTGQPNAMGGREVGGLATQLAAHMGFSDAERDRVRRFWNAPALIQGPGLKAVDLFEAVAAGHIRAVWIMATNPLVSLPDADRFRQALKECELVVVSDCVADTDTARLAHVLLPATTWGEKNGTVTNSERCISRQRPFLPPAGEARPDWWALTQVASRLGYGAAFDYRHPADIFVEHAALTRFENRGERILNLGPLADIDRHAYDALEPQQWPITAFGPTPRLLQDGRFATASRRARFVAVDAGAADAETDVRYPDTTVRAADQHGGSCQDTAPLILNTGRIRDQWHTITRTGIPRLLDHCGEPFVAIHPKDGQRLGLQDGRIASLHNRHGFAWLRVSLDAGQQPGQVFVPMHWSDANSAHARVNALLDTATDPHSGQPASKHGLCTLRDWNAASYGLLLHRDPLEVDRSDYWSRRPVPGGYALELASRAAPVASWRQWRERLGADGDCAELIDISSGHHRIAIFQDDRLIAWLAVATTPAALPERRWLFGVFERSYSDAASRRALLAGRDADTGSSGRLICSCASVTESAIAAAMASGCTTVQALGASLGCGRHCGSCIPELKQLLAQPALKTDVA